MPVVTLIEGDGVGPMVASVVRDVVQHLGAPISWDVQDGHDIDAAVASIRKHGLGLKAKVISRPVPKVAPYTVRFRRALGIELYERHVHSLRGLPARAPNIDIMVMREATEDIYAGFEHQSAPGVYESIKVTTRAACERVHRHAFEWARAHGRKRVTTVHKANIMKKSDGMFLAVGNAMAAEYPDLAHDDVIVDALCMQLVRRPQSFDVLVCGNLFGDIVSDCAAGMAGGLAVATAIGRGPGVTLFENTHSTTIDVVGEDGANPYPLLGLTCDLLREIGELSASQRLRRACEDALVSGLHTSDMGGTATCSAVRSAVIASL